MGTDLVERVVGGASCRHRRRARSGVGVRHRVALRYRDACFAGALGRLCDQVGYWQRFVVQSQDGRQVLDKVARHEWCRRCVDRLACEAVVVELDVQEARHLDRGRVDDERRADELRADSCGREPLTKRSNRSP